MRTIWKFPLPVSAGPWPTVQSTPVEMPEGAVIRHFTTQGGRPTVWAEVETNNRLERRAFVCVGTGHPLEQVGAYVGSYADDPFIWHIYEAAAPEWRDWEGDLMGDPPKDARDDTVVDIDQGGTTWTGPSSVVDWRVRCRYRLAAEQPER